ncbi:MAG: UDP-N-acetylglucosamine 2-epimerase (non-hydrolyzing) [Clostridia bacterium]|nr:UDP-N-acetylglucosamine 2-epimerase (non-hydrolyzing) [Clostridia bacterium]
MAKKLKVLSVFGTRPEAIKMAPLVQELQKEPQIESMVAVTAQHREMLDQVMDCFALTADYDLNIMKHGQSLAQITSAALEGLVEVMAKAKPDLVLVHGDTTTTFAGALAAFYNQKPSGHVEAGLRTGNKYAPYPEEMNRMLTGSLVDLHFAPTPTAKNNLLACGINENKIIITGNTVIDALLQTVKKDCDLASYGLAKVDWQKKVILLTCHRRENWGEPMEAIFGAVAKIAAERPELEIVFPVHKNPLVREIAKRHLANFDNVYLIEPLDYQPFAKLMDKSYLVLTDSGGMQEEAPSLGKPVLVLREVTERPEAVAAGTARLLGNTFNGVYDGINLLLDDVEVYRKMAQAGNPYGDGFAAKRIVEAILKWHKQGML